MSIQALITAGNAKALRKELSSKKFKAATLEKPNSKGMTALHSACLKGQADIVQLLLDHGANIEAVDRQKATPLLLAAVHHHLAVVHLLLSRGASAKAINAGRDSVLHCLVRREAPDQRTASELEALVFICIEKGAPVNGMNKYSETALHLACNSNSEAMVRCLICNGADTNKVNKWGETALHKAVMTNSKALVKLLLLNGADPRIESSRGTCRELCDREKYPELWRILDRAERAKPLQRQKSVALRDARQSQLFDTWQRLEAMDSLGRKTADVPTSSLSPPPSISETTSENPSENVSVEEAEEDSPQPAAKGKPQKQEFVPADAVAIVGTLSAASRVLETHKRVQFTASPHLSQRKMNSLKRHAGIPSGDAPPSPEQDLNSSLSTESLTTNTTMDALTRSLVDDLDHYSLEDSEEATEDTTVEESPPPHASKENLLVPVAEASTPSSNENPLVLPSRGFTVECSGECEIDGTPRLISVSETYKELFFEKPHMNFLCPGSKYSQRLQIVSVLSQPELSQYIVLSLSRDGYKRETVQNQQVDSTRKGPIERWLRWIQRNLCPDSDVYYVDSSQELQEELLRVEALAPEKTSCFRIGVVLGKKGQTTEEQMFTNTQMTSAFSDFLDCIADRIQLMGWGGYRGQLSVTTPGESYYTEWNGVEIMFHVTSMLNSEQQRRLVGNDTAIIYFHEDDSPFSAETPRSAMSQVFAVVHPNSTSSTYQLAFFSRKKVRPFGPELPPDPTFKVDVESGRKRFRDFLLSKVVNGYRTAINSPPLDKMFKRPREAALKGVIKAFPWSKGKKSHYLRCKKKS